MSSEVASTSVNGGSSNSASLAAMLEQQHARGDDAHKATVEDVQDEEDIKHPPPSSLVHDRKPDTTLQPTAGEAAASTSTQAPKVVPKKVPAFDVQSEESFPALGAGPKPKAATPAPATWGASKQSAAAALANGIPNGSQKQGAIHVLRYAPFSASSLCIQTDSSEIGFGSSDTPRIMTLPGKHIEQLRLAPSQMLSSNQLKKPLRDILRDISRRSKANVDIRGGPGGSIVFEGKGSVDAVRQALKDVAQQVGSKV